jgi:hypothetical protein
MVRKRCDEIKKRGIFTNLVFSGWAVGFNVENNETIAHL